MSIIRFCDICDKRIEDNFGGVRIQIREKERVGTDHMEINHICPACLVGVRERIQAVAPNVEIKHYDWDDLGRER